MKVQEKIKILADGAKYDVSCTSSGSDRKSKSGMVGNAVAPGICHSWSADGRCISLLKILMSNACSLDCAYCVNRKSADVERATLSPMEIINLTMAFYKRNYIEGLFLSSGVLNSPDETMRRMLYVVQQLRDVHRFNGYIHVKAIPGASFELIDAIGAYADRMSINMEVPEPTRLQLLAPGKTFDNILKPMAHIASNTRKGNYRYPAYVPAGQSSQIMVGTGGDTDYSILTQAGYLYKQFNLKRVFYSAYIPIIQDNPLLPQRVDAPLLREHRLYQCDWLFRFYGFSVEELLDQNQPNLLLTVDPKAFWALRNMAYFPVELTKATLDTLLRVPGIGPTSARRIIEGRRSSALTYDSLKRMGVVLKRAQYFCLIQGVPLGKMPSSEGQLIALLSAQERPLLGAPQEQISLLETHGQLLGTWAKT